LFKNQFIPKINPNSKKLDRKRNATSKSSRHNLLLKAGNKYKNIKSQKSLERQNQKMKDCTFYPDTKKSSKSRLINKSDTGYLKTTNVSDIFLQESTLPDLKSRERSRDKSKFMKDIRSISPINKETNNINFEISKTKLNFPYKPLPSGMNLKEKEILIEKGIEKGKSIRDKLKEKKAKKHLSHVNAVKKRNYELNP